jgi:cytochrome P450
VPITLPEVLDAEVDVLYDDLPDVAATLHGLRARKPALWAKGFGAPALLLLSHELVNAAFKDEETFPSAEFYGRTVTDVLGRNLQCMRGEEHRRNRALVSPAFRQRLMPGLVEPLLEPVAHELIDRFEAHGAADLVTDFTSRYPFIIITRLLGLPRSSEEQIKHWALTMLDIRKHHGAALQASQEFVAFVDPLLQQRRYDPGEDLLSTLATTEVDGERLTDEEIFDFLRLLFPAGADTTYLGLGNTLYALLTHPDQLALLLEDLPGRARGAAEEGIRLNPPVAWINRIAPQDLVWHDVPIPAGTMLLLGIMAANRDPAAFPDPDRFDVLRKPGNVMTFGFGTHFCLGAHLARAELETSLRIILSRLPHLRLTRTDGVRITGTIHHLLRGPNRLPVAFG